MRFERIGNSTYGCVNPGEFWALPNVRLSFGPLSFSLHDLDMHGWAASFAQRRTARQTFRGQLRLYPSKDQNSGFTIRLPVREFASWHDLLLALSTIEGGVKFHAKQEIKAAPVVIEAHVPIEEALARHNAEALAALGDWRPRKDFPPPDMSNVVVLRQIMAEIEAEAA